jgi:hypothetical protein
MPMSVTEARAMIEQRKGDKEWYARIKAQDPAAHAEWDRLHKVAYPSAPQVTSISDVTQQADARTARIWNERIAAIKQKIPNLTTQQEAEIRGGVIARDLHAWVKGEIAMQNQDRAWYLRWKSGDRAAIVQREYLIAMLALRPI